MIDKVTKDLKSALPIALVDFLMTAYLEIKENYLLERHEPSELNGGKFVEACYRILEHETKGSFTAIGAHMPDMIGKLRAFEQLPATAAIESYRIHIPRALCMIYNIRNKRGVGHLGGDVNPNFTDSTMICACSDWVLAELLRVHYSFSLDEAQKLVDGIVIRPTFLVHQIADIKRILNPDLKNSDQVLVLLASEFPKPTSDITLFNWIEPKSKGTFFNLLKQMHSKRLIEYSSDKTCSILPTGLKYVDKNHKSFINS
ncbi:MAG: hypothetical protein GC205_10930 [Bacteroidetes bacterium]|nr:hypothetical protein [Bacteroidota bacterium]